MQKKNYTPLLLIGIFIALFFAALVFIKINATGGIPQEDNEVSPSADLSVDNDQAKILFYTSVNCPHCQNVDRYLSDRTDIYQKLGLQKRSLDEQIHYEARQTEMSRWAKECNLSSNTIGIPFIYINDSSLAANERCIIGDQPIIDYFEEHYFAD